MMNPGESVGPYHIVGKLGAGGMGEVYRARDTKLNRDVAVKVPVEELKRRGAAAFDPAKLEGMKDVGVSK